MNQQIEFPVRIGTGVSPVVRSHREHCWQSLQALFARESISRPTDWSIRDDRHVVIIHLSGMMKVLETELDRRLGSIGPATPGELWSVPAGSEYASFAQGGDIEFAVFYLPKRSSTQDSELELSPLSGVRDDTLLSMVRRLTETSIEHHDTSKMESETLADAIGDHIRLRYQRPSADVLCLATPVRLSSYQARMIREFVWESLSERITIGQIAGLVKMTTHDLLTAFREVFQTTPAQYIISQRLRRAQWLLLHSNWDITRIALECGFSSHSHLSSSFTNRVGYPPSKYRDSLSASKL